MRNKCPVWLVLSNPKTIPTYIPPRKLSDILCVEDPRVFPEAGVNSSSEIYSR